MGSDTEKATVFLQRLWNNHSMLGLSPPQKEDQLRQFLKINASTLEPTLGSAAYFPNRRWVWIWNLLSETLSNMTYKAMLPQIEGILNKNIDFSFITHLPHPSATPEELRNQLDTFMKTLAARGELRRVLAGPLHGAGSDLVDRYLTQIFQNKRYINFEIRKVQRLKLEVLEIINLIKCTLLIRPAVQLYSPPKLGMNPVTITAPLAAKALEQLRKALDLFPEVLLRSGVHSALPFLDNPYLESSARLTAIFAQRCQFMRQGLTVDRGAETLDKSWFSVARKNYKFHGFDLDMLVELYNIAAENGW